METEEEYFVRKAKESLSDSDPYIAKSWMVNARVLYPNNFAIQFEAYLIEKSLKDTKEAAKCLSDVCLKFPDAVLLWKEVHSLTTALRSTSGDHEAEFLREMFNHVPVDVQRQILLSSAERSEDTMEHCRLLLLLLNRFPTVVGQHGNRLMNTLMTAEKHKYYRNAVNCYRKLLVCDFLPLLGACLKADIPDFVPKRLLKLLNKAIEFFLHYMTSPNKVIQNLPDSESRIEDPWKNLCKTFHIIGEKLEWKLSAIFIDTCNRDVWWQTLSQKYKMHGEDEVMYCTALILLNTLYEYNHMVRGGAIQLVLIECNVDKIESVGEPKNKRQRLMDQPPTITLGVNDGTGNTPAIVNNLTMGVHSWDLLHSSEMLKKAFFKLTNQLQLESWYSDFLADVSLYKGNHEECLHVTLQSQDAKLRKYIRLANLHYCEGHCTSAAESLFVIVSELSNIPHSTTSLVANAAPDVMLPTALLQTQTSPATRHLEFLQLAKTPVLKYCVALLLAILQKKSASDLAIGHMFVLLQLDWPPEGDLALQLFQCLKTQGCFTYHLFQPYIVQIELLEKFMWLSTEQAGCVMLDLFVPTGQQLSQRRITTRGADKGSKEDFKLAMRKQVGRSDDPIDVLIVKFITSERELIMQAIA